jgi:hypothetical protein
MRVRLVGDNARYLARHWREAALVESSDDEEIVEFYPKAERTRGRRTV